jgi:hypothetical protein
MKKKQILTRLEVEVSRDGKMHFIYTPDQDQQLIKGQEYEIIFSPDGIKLEAVK